MSYQWSKILDLCEHLINTSAVDEETRGRTVHSRAYYYAHNSACDWLTFNTAFVKPHAGSHKAVIEQFKAISSSKSDPASRVASGLQLLRARRVKADYKSQTTDIWTDKNSTLAIHSAKQIMASLKSVTV